MKYFNLLILILGINFSSSNSERAILSEYICYGTNENIRFKLTLFNTSEYEMENTAGCFSGPNSSGLYNLNTNDEIVFYPDYILKNYSIKFENNKKLAIHIYEITNLTKTNVYLQKNDSLILINQKITTNQDSISIYSHLYGVQKVKFSSNFNSIKILPYSIKPANGERSYYTFFGNLIREISYGKIINNDIYFELNESLLHFRLKK